MLQANHDVNWSPSQDPELCSVSFSPHLKFTAEDEPSDFN